MSANDNVYKKEFTQGIYSTYGRLITNMLSNDPT